MYNGLNPTGGAEGHATDNPNCTVGCASGLGNTAQWTCAPGGLWVPTYPLCFEYEPVVNATAGSQYLGPSIRTNLDPVVTAMVASVNATGLDPGLDSVTVSNDPADFGAVTAHFSPRVNRLGHPPVRVQLDLEYTDDQGERQALALPEFEIEIASPLASSGSTQFAFAGQAFIGQEPGIVGGKAPYSFRLSAGTLPPGFSLDDKGTILGTTTQVGDFPGVVVQAVDANQATLNLEAVNFRIIPALKVSTNVSGTLPTATEGVEYYQGFNFSTTGGLDTVTYEAKGSMPQGLAVDEATGTIQGVPAPRSARPEPYLFEIVASDESGIQVLALLVSLVVEAPPDCSDPSNGPNEQGCGTGSCVDETPFDEDFTCNCTGNNST